MASEINRDLIEAYRNTRYCVQIDSEQAEASLFIAGVDASYIEALGVAFQQYAVVTGDVGGVAELRFLCPIEK